MIKLRESVVMTLLPDGSTAAMEVDLLQTKLKRSWSAAGYPDDSIAEDVATSVELALSEFGNVEAFTPAEIDSFVVKVLREAGLTEVAEHYGLDFSPVNSTVPFNRNEILKIIRKFMSMDENASHSLCERVLNAGKKLNFSHTPPTLVLELAKFFHLDSSKLDHATVETLKDHPDKFQTTSTWLITGDEIFSETTSTTQAMLAAKYLTVRNISALFPLINVEFDITKFTNSSEFIPPVPDFALLPHLSEAIDGVNDILKVVDTYILKFNIADSRPIAAHLKIVNPDIFTEIWLGAEWPGARESLVELLKELSNSFTREVILHM
jgi:hypothetical protein